MEKRRNYHFDTERYITNAVNDNKHHLTQCLNLIDVFDISSGDSISRGDVAFLLAVCLQEKPNTIMEIGTWVGRSAYTMAIASEADIYTCDSGDNMFTEIEEYSNKVHLHPNFAEKSVSGDNVFINVKEYLNRIHLHPNTHSDVFLKKELPKFDMVFVDGMHTDAKSIFDVCEDSFTLVAHDYFNVNTLAPCKGMEIIWRISEYAENNNYTYTVYPSIRDWIPDAYHVEGFGGVNTCCGMIKVSKNNGKT